jgi:hypothetical protein
MRDPKEALEDMLLDDIFGPFNGLFESERIDDVRKVFLGEAKTLSAETLGAVERFVEAAKEFRKETAYDPFAGAKNKGAAVDTKTAVKEWEKTIAAYAAAFKAAKPAGKNGFAVTLRAALVDDLRLCAFIYGSAALGLCAAIAGKNANGAEAVTLFEYWHLDRKTRECFEHIGIDGGKAYRFIETAKAFTRRLVTGKSGIRAEWVKGVAIVNALSIVQNNKNREDFRRLLGVNEWEGVEWFNKEAFEEVLFHSATIGTAYAGFDTVSSIVADVSAAETKSEYKLAALINALGGKPKTQAKKTAAKKKS